MRRTLFGTSALGLLLCALFAGCTVAAGSEAMFVASPEADWAERSDDSGGAPDGAEAPRFGFTSAPDSEGEPGGDSDEPAGSADAATSRLLIRTADFAIEVPRAEDAIAEWTAEIATLGGYLSQRDGTRLVCRIPASQFETCVTRLRATGRVLRESMQALDVTEQHRNLSIRLANAKTARERLLTLLERAEKVEDLLKIENELRRLTVEIEQMTAALENLDDRVAMSTVTVEFVATTSDARPPQRRRPSRFPWINTVGAENVLRNF